MTKQAIKTAIVACARKLGHAPTSIELFKMAGISQYFVRTRFGGFNQALEQCHLKTSREHRRVPISDLLRDWATVVRKLERVPTIAEYRNLGSHSDTPLRKCFRSWQHVPRGFRQHAEDNGWKKEWQDVLEITARHSVAAASSLLSRSNHPRKPRLFLDRPIYGPLMHRSQLAHGPMNESGVIYLFGAMADRLGFVVMRIQNGFPDCEAMRRIDKNRWQQVRVEFEFESRNFLKHRHPAKGCDLIVCWKHNWPECPLEVLELSRPLL